jgi:hypothetical protein
VRTKTIECEWIGWIGDGDSYIRVIVNHQYPLNRLAALAVPFAKQNGVSIREEDIDSGRMIFRGPINVIKDGQKKFLYELRVKKIYNSR